MGNWGGGSQWNEKEGDESRDLKFSFSPFLESLLVAWKGGSVKAKPRIVLIYGNGKMRCLLVTLG